MKRLGFCTLVLVATVVVIGFAADQPATVTVDYPQDGSIFPPDIAAPTFLWRDTAEDAALWRIEIGFGDGADPIRVDSRGEGLRIGEIDPRTVAETNELPKLTPLQAAAHTWKPDADTWEMIKKRSVARMATVTITGYRPGNPREAVSRGSIGIQTSKDPVGAPIFYRDVPLMPSEVQKGVIKPLAKNALPLINWRLRDIGKSSSKIMMTNLHTCANCHSFSGDGKTMGLDMDGPQNDKGLYALTSVKPQMSIGTGDMIAWSMVEGKLTGDQRVGFMSQVSPDGKYVATTLKGPDLKSASDNAVSNFYVANFTNYRFLQVFYPTRGILAWYSRETGVLQPLPGADDPRFVQAGGFWSPDGKYLVFMRAEAREPYPAGVPRAEYPLDPNETQIQYDLYRIPFNGGKGGKAEPIQGASNNGMSNSFPKVSPDGKWIVFVKSRNGLLIRPDSELYIVPATGGKARRMRCNTSLMNSWHSFSPNGRWMVFSSKSRSPYTDMFLTHLDEEGNSSPPILIENSKAANRAVNIPEFVNIPPDGMLRIATPAVDYYRVFDEAWELAEKGKHEDAVEEWRKAVELSPKEAKPRVLLGGELIRTGHLEEAIEQCQRALEIQPTFAEAHNNLGIALAKSGKLDEAITQYQKALKINPDYAEAHNGLGLALASSGRPDLAIAQYRKALEIQPDYPGAHNNLGILLAGSGRLDEAISEYRAALISDQNNSEIHNNLGVALGRAGKVDEAIVEFQETVKLSPESAKAQQTLALALAGAGRLAESVPHFRKVVEIDPNSAEAHNNLGRALAEMGQPDDAVAEFQKALAVDPNFTEAHFYLGNALYTQGKAAEGLAEWRAVLKADPNQLQVLVLTARLLATSPEAPIRDGAEAVALAERAVRLSGGQQPAILDTLAAAYAEAGRFPEAVQTARQALELATSGKQQALVQVLKTRIALYEAGTPLRLQPPSSAAYRR